MMSANVFKCNYCNKNFDYNKNLLRHLRNVHKLTAHVDGNISCPLYFLCNNKLQNMEYLQRHLEDTHEIKILREELEFSSTNGKLEKPRAATGCSSSQNYVNDSLFENVLNLEKFEFSSASAMFVQRKIADHISNSRIFSDEEQIQAINYLDSLFPSIHQLQYTFDFARDVAALLKPISKYIAVVNTTREYESIQWEEFEENFTLKDLISKEMNHIDSKEFVSKDVIEQLPSTLHALADLLPAFGTYKLDVFIGSNVLKNLSVSKEPLLSNVLFRFALWHSAYFSIFLQQECDLDRLEEWCEIINAKILHSNSKSELGAVLWRGTVELQLPNNQESLAFQGFELKFDLIENEDTIFYNSHSEDSFQINLEHTVLSSKMKVVDEISFQTIPPYMLTPIAFRLHTSKPNVLNEKSSCFTDYLLSNKEAALIMRLEYAEINEKIKPDRKYSTSRWQRTVSSGCFKGPECFVSTFKSYITFAVTKSRKSNHVLAYPLRNTMNFSENFFFSIINSKECNKSSHLSERTVDITEDILSMVPCIQASNFHEILTNHAKLSYKTINNKSDSLQPGTEDAFMSFWNDVKKSSSSSLGMKSKAADFQFEEIDPSDWPERIQLLRKQMQKEEKQVPYNALLAQNLKLPQQSFSISSEDISKHFLPSGEPKNSTSIEFLNPPNMDHFVTHDFDEVLHLNWPEIMNCIYHDIYYNSNCQAEDKESLGSQMVKLYIQHETASSCNNQQAIQSFSITLLDKHSSPFKEFRSPSCRQAGLQKPSKIDYIITKGNSMKDLLTKKVLFSSKASHCEITSRNKKEEQNVINGVHNKRKSSDPIRCSPRKKISVNYSAPVRCSPRKKTPVNYSAPVRCSPRKNTVNYSAPVRCSPRKNTRSGPSRYSPRKKIPLNNGSIRSSPRKKNVVNYCNSSSSRNSDASKSGSNSKSHMPELLRKKIRSAVATALENNGINLNHPFYQPCGSRLFAICQTFLQDLSLKKGKTSEYLQKIADAHVKQVIEFYKD